MVNRLVPILVCSLAVLFLVASLVKGIGILSFSQNSKSKATKFEIEELQYTIKDLDAHILSIEKQMLESGSPQVHLSALEMFKKCKVQKIEGPFKGDSNDPKYYSYGITGPLNELILFTDSIEKIQFSPKLRALQLSSDKKLRGQNLKLTVLIEAP